MAKLALRKASAYNLSLLFHRKPPCKTPSKPYASTAPTAISKPASACPNCRWQTIIDCARQAPSWMNGQHYSIINITDPALRAQIVALQPGNPQIGTCSTYLLFIADLHRAGLASQACQGSSTPQASPTA